jgi:hypothetical protein
VGTKTVELEFVYDRLGDERLSQAYLLLVPENARKLGACEEELRKGNEDQVGSDLRPCLLPTARRAGDYR